MPKLLEESEIERQLSMVDRAWSVIDGSRLERTFKFEDFASALAFVNKVGKLAEKQNHHPDAQLSWGKVVLSVTTHSAGGLTDRDFGLATAIDQLA